MIFGVRRRRERIAGLGELGEVASPDDDEVFNALSDNELSLKVTLRPCLGSLKTKFSVALS